jgi:hypothetical protein
MTGIRTSPILKKEGFWKVPEGNYKDKIIPKEKRAYFRNMGRNQTMQVSTFVKGIIPADLRF